MYEIPFAVKAVMALGLLLAIDKLAPGVVPTVLVLVALYLVLTKSQLVEAATGALDSFNAALEGPPGTGNKKK